MMMNRRTFLQSLGLGLAFVATAPLLSRVTGYQRLGRHSIGQFTVEDDGILSIGGQRKFPVYDGSGGLARKHIQYRHVGFDIVRAEECAA
jgi:hypothetical protein